MVMSINKLAVKEGASTFYEPGFHHFLESYMGYLRTHPSTVSIAVDPHDNYKYEGDLYGLLAANGIEHHHHWLVMRLNDIKRPSQVDPNLMTLLVPDLSLIDRLRQLYLSVNKKTAS